MLFLAITIYRYSNISQQYQYRHLENIMILLNTGISQSTINMFNNHAKHAITSPTDKTATMRHLKYMYNTVYLLSTVYHTYVQQHNPINPTGTMVL